MPIQTVFSMVEDCARGGRAGWYALVRDYSGVARGLLEHYFPTLRAELDAYVLGVFRRAQSNANTWFGGLRFANEREFLISFRHLVFAYARPLARIPAPDLGLEHARELKRDLTVVQAEMLWMYLKGYGVGQTAAILMNADSTAAAVKKIADDRLANLNPGGVEPNAPLSVLLEAAERAGTPECLTLKTCNNLINGQISWQERDRAEQHICECVHCLDRFTSFQEMIWYHRAAQPLIEAQVNAVLAELGLAASRGLVARLFSKSA